LVDCETDDETADYSDDGGYGDGCCGLSEGDASYKNNRFHACALKCERRQGRGKRVTDLLGEL